VQLFLGGGGRGTNVSSNGHVSVYLFAVDAPISAKYQISLLKPILKQSMPRTQVHHHIPVAFADDLAPSVGLPIVTGQAATIVAVPSVGGVSSSGASTPTPNMASTTDSQVLYEAKSSGVKPFNTAIDGWGFFLFLPLTQLLASPYCINDTITFEITTSFVVSIDDNQSVPLQVSANNTLSKDMERLFMKREWSDMSFNVEGHRIYGHWFILCVRSKYFQVSHIFVTIPCC
jgi:hypothetical protein